MKAKDYLILLGLIILSAGLMLLQKCAHDKDIKDLTNQVARHNDTTIIYRDVDGKTVADAPAAGLTINEYRAADPSGLAAFERIIGKKDDLISTLLLEIQNERRRGTAIPTTDSSGTITVPYMDSCLILQATIPKDGPAIIDYQLQPQTFMIATVMQREKWYKSKELVATGTVSSGCGTITNQKVVLISPGKKKVYQTNGFKAIVAIVGFEVARFLITGKL